MRIMSTFYGVMFGAQTMGYIVNEFDSHRVSYISGFVSDKANLSKWVYFGNFVFTRD